MDWVMMLYFDYCWSEIGSLTPNLVLIYVFVCFSPNLTWRDLQHIVVKAARPANLRTNDWVTNGVGRKGKTQMIP